jgi:DNA invertase Pin-like site-specific DNA recombinase
MSETLQIETTVYHKGEGESIKFAPKIIYSTEYKKRKNLRVAAYIRVSTDSDEQAGSLETQEAHYKKLIAENKNWIFSGIYSDEGISATSTKHRNDFRQMVIDAEAGKFDMLITKDVTRYARNLLDGILTARKLRDLNPPVGILFENDGLNTLNKESELILSILLSVAQGDSEKKSKSIREAFQWRCDEHDYFTPTNNLLGYTKENGKHKPLAIEAEGAKTVRAIYAMYLYGLNTRHIAYILTVSGRLTAKDNKVWNASSVAGILRNERYCGDVVAQKTVTVNVLEHKSMRNTGQVSLHYKDNHHNPIVSREECVRALLLLRSNNASPYYNPDYEIQAVREGLLAGFIPLNFAFGGYDAEHYLGAEIKCGVKLPDYTVDIMSIPNCRLIRVQEIEHRLAAQVTVSTKSIVFNTDCQSRFKGVNYVEVLLHPTERLLAVRPTTNENRNAVPWGGKSISASYFCPMLFSLMGWNVNWKYKFMADCFERGGERLLMFNLSEPEFQFVEFINHNEEIKERIRHLLLPGSMRDEFGAKHISRIVASRRAYALTLEDWKIDAPALPIEGYPGNPTSRTEAELKSYLETQGVKYG